MNPTNKTKTQRWIGFGNNVYPRLERRAVWVASCPSSLRSFALTRSMSLPGNLSPASPPAPLRAIQRLKTELYANSSGGRLPPNRWVRPSWERERFSPSWVKGGKGVGNWDTGSHNLLPFASYLMVKIWGGWELPMSVRRLPGLRPIMTLSVGLNPGDACEAAAAPQAENQIIIMNWS